MDALFSNVARGMPGQEGDGDLDKGRELPAAAHVDYLVGAVTVQLLPIILDQAIIFRARATIQRLTAW